MAVFVKKTKLLISIISACILIACGHGMVLTEQWGKVVNHGFEFDVVSDSPDIEVLNYEYSTKKPRRDQLLGIGGNRVAQQTGIYGGFPVGDFIYMKWRVRSTGGIFEDRVDLRGRLPRDITDHKIYCVIDGKQLYVLLIDAEARKKISKEELDKYNSAATNPLGVVLRYTLSLKSVTQIYPDPITQLR